MPGGRSRVKAIVSLVKAIVNTSDLLLLLEQAEVDILSTLETSTYQFISSFHSLQFGKVSIRVKSILIR